MEVLYSNQKRLQNQIANAFSNFKKLGQSKMLAGHGRARLQQRNERFEQFKRNHNDILELKDISVNHDYFEHDLFDNVEENYYNNLGEFNEFLTPLNTSVGESHQNQSFNSNNSVNFQSLPTIEIPTFSGKYEEWSNFRDIFKAIIHSKADLLPVLKHQYLRSHLTDEASDLIKNIPLAGESYPQAWNTILDYYDNKRRLVTEYVKTIVTAGQMSNSSSSSLKKLMKETIGPLDTLRNMGRDGYTDVVIGLITSKFEFYTAREWQRYLGCSTEAPSMDQLRSFLSSQVITLESFTQKPPINNKNVKETISKSTKEANVKSAHQTNVKPGISCTYCKGSHFIFKCPDFLRLGWTSKKEFVGKAKLCINCLGNHPSKICKSKYTCFNCKKMHHTVMHRDKDLTRTSNKESECISSEVKQPIDNTSLNVYTTQINSSHSVLLATARVLAYTKSGKPIIVRALIDPCSQTSLISRSLTQMLQLKQNKVCIKLTGVGEKIMSEVTSAVDLTLKPYFKSDFSLKINALMVNKISAYRPPDHCHYICNNTLNNLQLADPEFYKSDQIDLLLGASAHALIIQDQVLKLGINMPIASKSSLGWLLSGPVSSNNDNNKTGTVTSLYVTEVVPLTELVKQFWEVEEIPKPSEYLTNKEKECEKIFKDTHLITDSGRFSVKLPFKASTDSLHAESQKSYQLAKNMLLRMETRFNSNVKLKSPYSLFMKEYRDLNHMSLVSSDSSVPRWYLPHHGVIKEASTTTKLRVVFNGSATVGKNTSLNALLHAGQNLLPNIFDLILKWRNYRFVFIADIQKMFRQILIQPSDRPYQSILWRENPQDDFSIYELNTVTYGLVSAPFLASRTLKQLAENYKSKFPLGASILENEVYMDDFISGGHSCKEAKQKIDQLIGITQRGCFELRKWTSNCSELLEKIPLDYKNEEQLTLLTSETYTSILGLMWKPNTDSFCFKIKTAPQNIKWTKRSMLSQLAKFFDPLGWLSPTIIKAKILMQATWLLKISWDDPLPSKIADDWIRWLDGTKLLEKINISRWNRFSPDIDQLELHGFADASKEAYAAVLYLRIVVKNQVHTQLLTSKTKVAPIKILSIPRLELCAASLLAKLVKHYTSLTANDKLEIHLWTDSKIVLHWLNDLPSKLPTFIANRCSHILTSVPEASWHHISSKDNPADIASRGIYPSQLLESSLCLMDLI